MALVPGQGGIAVKSRALPICAGKLRLLSGDMLSQRLAHRLVWLDAARCNNVGASVLLGATSKDMGS